MRRRSHIAARSGAAVLALASVAGVAGAARESMTVEPSAWRIIERESGPVNYYAVMREGDRSFVRARYVPPMKTAVLGWQTPDEQRRKLRKVAWTWRAQTLPLGADECTKGKGDSAAVVYLTWKRGLRYYTLKYTWSTAGKKGRVCSRRRDLFVAQDTIILESGPSSNAWRGAEVDLDAAFRKYFEDGNQKADVPDFLGIGLMSDGDQTQSESSADYGPFTLTF